MRKPNSRKNAFIESYPDDDIETKKLSFQTHLCFSFEYFDNSQPVGQSFSNWTQEQLTKLCNKLHNYSRETIEHWTRQSIGDGERRGKVLAIYGRFPQHSEFRPPKHVPQGVSWSRFRLEGDMRLIGFLIPRPIAMELNINPNVFYIVFLDEYHRFYKTEG